MRRTLGIFLILFSCWGYGFQQSVRLTGRLRSLEMMRRGAVLLRGEIRFGNASLSAAFREAGEKLGGDYGSFFCQVGQKLTAMEGKSFYSIYSECARNNRKLLGIEKEEEELFLALGSHLGYLDLEMQIKELMLLEEELTRRTEELRREIPEKKKVYESLGILGGILLAVLVW